MSVEKQKLNPNHCSITGKHTPVKNQSWFQCRFCHKKCDSDGALSSTQIKFFDKDTLYKEIVEFYLKKHYTLEHANDIAQKKVMEYLEKNKKDIMLDG